MCYVCVCVCVCATTTIGYIHLREYVASSGTLNPSILYHTFENIFLTANPKTASPVQQHITLAVLMYKVRSMSTPVYYMTESQKVSTAELYVHLRSRC